MLTEVVSKIKDEIEQLNGYHVVMADDNMHIYSKEVTGSYTKITAVIHIVLIPEQMQLFVQAFMRKSEYTNGLNKGSLKLTKSYLNIDSPCMLDNLSSMVKETNIAVHKYAETGEV